MYLGVPRRSVGSVAAIKILRDAWLSPARRERFASEQRTLAQLAINPAIARLYDADTLPGGTPWLSRWSMSRACPSRTTAARGTRPAADRLRAFHRVCRGSRHTLIAAWSCTAICKPSEYSRHGRRRREAARLRHRPPDRSGRKGRDADARRPAATHARVIRLARSRFAARRRRCRPTYARSASSSTSCSPGGRRSKCQRCRQHEPRQQAARRGADAPSRSYRAAARDERDGPVHGRLELISTCWCLPRYRRDQRRGEYAGSVEGLIRDLDHYLANEPLEAQRDSLA